MEKRDAVQARCENGRLLIMCFPEWAFAVYPFPESIDEGHCYLIVIQPPV